jgi:hypothetical protein
MTYLEVLGYICITSLAALCVTLCLTGIGMIAIKVYDWWAG